jgi:hypothetical protein
MVTCLETFSGPLQWSPGRSVNLQVFYSIQRCHTAAGGVLLFLEVFSCFSIEAFFCSTGAFLLRRTSSVLRNVPLSLEVFNFSWHTCLLSWICSFVSRDVLLYMEVFFHFLQSFPISGGLLLFLECSSVFGGVLLFLEVFICFYLCPSVAEVVLLVLLSCFWRSSPVSRGELLSEKKIGCKKTYRSRPRNGRPGHSSSWRNYSRV